MVEGGCQVVEGGCQVVEGRQFVEGVWEVVWLSELGRYLLLE